MQRPSSLYLSVKDEIVDSISRRELKPGDKLPSEYELAKKFGVSRMTLRESLRALEEEGLLARRQGVGTFVKARSHRIKSILDINYGVSEMITNMGFRPGTQEHKVEDVRADVHLAKTLNIAESAKVITIERVRTADGIPVVYSLDMIPDSILPDTEDIKKLDGSVYDYLEQKCHVILSSSMARLFPTKAIRKLADKLNIKIGSPLFLLEQTDTDQAGMPVVFSREYFVSDYFDFVIYRRRKK
ncbi:MAG: GntR family transcriptional regulator [Deltaproteobacteria bacterium]|nr:GntR family transcriptional regulator [Deltaproteobacteria bacterium]